MLVSFEAFGFALTSSVRRYGRNFIFGDHGRCGVYTLYLRVGFISRTKEKIGSAHQQTFNEIAQSPSLDSSTSAGRVVAPVLRFIF